MTRIVARVVSQKGSCEFGHKLDDEFIIGQTASSGICAWALYTLFPFAEVLQFGGSFPWEKDPGKARVACPDPDNPVIFELRRTETP